MKRATSPRRSVLIGVVAVLAAWEPSRVRLQVVNASDGNVEVRAVGGDAWIPAKAGADVELPMLLHHGLCGPPDRWLPDDFAGIEFKLADGSIVEVPRQTFEAEAEYNHRWIYRFRKTAR